MEQAGGLLEDAGEEVLDNNSETSRVESKKRYQSGNYVDFYHPEKLRVQDFAYLHRQHA